MWILGQVISLDLGTIVMAGGTLAMSLLVYLLKTRIEDVENNIKATLAAQNECRVSTAKIETRLAHIERRVDRGGGES